MFLEQVQNIWKELVKTLEKRKWVERDTEKVLWQQSNVANVIIKIQITKININSLY